MIQVFECIIYLIIKILVYISPRCLITLYPKILGSLLYKIDRQYNDVIMKNLDIAFPEMDSERKQGIVKQNFYYFSRFIIDLLNYSRSSKINKIVEEKNLNSLKKAVKQDKGAIIISGHLGHWELGLLWIGENIVNLNAVVRKMENNYVEKEIKKLREQTGNKILYKNEKAAIKLGKILRKKGFIGLMVDLDQQKKEGIFVDFFSKRASTNPGAAFFHLKFGSPIIPVFCVPKGKKYQIYSLPPVKVNYVEDKEKMIKKIMLKINRTLENEISKLPENYFWFHKRWRHRPDGEKRIY